MSVVRDFDFILYYLVNHC